MDLTEIFWDPAKIKKAVIEMRRTRSWQIIKLIHRGIHTLPLMAIELKCDDCRIKRLIDRAAPMIISRPVKKRDIGAGRFLYFIHEKYRDHVEACFKKQQPIHSNPKSPGPTDFEIMKIPALMKLNSKFDAYHKRPNALLDTLTLFENAKHGIGVSHVTSHLWPGLDHRKYPRRSALKILRTLRREGLIIYRGARYIIHPDCRHIATEANRIKPRTNDLVGHDELH